VGGFKKIGIWGERREKKRGSASRAKGNPVVVILASVKKCVCPTKIVSGSCGLECGLLLLANLWRGSRRASSLRSRGKIQRKVYVIEETGRRPIENASI